MYCAQCGTANAEGSEACEVCGSPLAPSTGNLTCFACGTSVSELDRFCYTCGNSLTGPTGRRYEPDPSFIDDEPIEVDVATLPTWLRQIVENTPDARLVSPQTTTVMHAEPEDELPNWLQDTSFETESPPDELPMAREREQTPPATPSQASERSEPMNRDHGNEETFSFLTEDDLPEWLRALGNEPVMTSAEESAVTPEPLQADVSVSSMRFSREVPSVSRAWLSRPRQVDPAQDDQARTNFLPIRAVQQHLEAAPSAVAPAPEESQETATMPTADSVDVDRARRTRRVRLLLAALVVAVLLLVVLLVAQNVA